MLKFCFFFDNGHAFDLNPLVESIALQKLRDILQNVVDTDLGVEAETDNHLESGQDGRQDEVGPLIKVHQDHRATRQVIPKVGRAYEPPAVYILVAHYLFQMTGSRGEIRRARRPKKMQVVAGWLAAISYKLCVDSTDQYLWLLEKTQLAETSVAQFRGGEKKSYYWQKSNFYVPVQQ